MNNLPEVIENIINDYVEQMDMHLKREKTMKELQNVDNVYRNLYTEKYFSSINRILVIGYCLCGRGYYNSIIMPHKKDYEKEDGFYREQMYVILTEEQEEEHERTQLGEELYEEYMAWIDAFPRVY